MTPRAFLVIVAMAAASAAVSIGARRTAGVPGSTAAPTIRLTAVAAQGLWTDEEVTAANAWRSDFRPAQPVLRRGEAVRLRLESADVVHTFTLPELGIDRVEVYPGRVVEIVATPGRAGTFPYYCTTVCGETHFAMRGAIRVDDEVRASDARPPATVRRYWQEPPPPPAEGRLARGAWRFRQVGCVTCHGEGGRGGVGNPNSMNALVPELATLSRRSFLFTPADVESFLRLLDSPIPLERVQAAPRVPLFTAVRTQHLALRRLVREGRQSTRLDPSGLRPPLDMPAWGSRLTDEEVDEILSYLISQGATADRPAVDAHSSIREGEVQ